MGASCPLGARGTQSSPQSQERRENETAKRHHPPTAGDSQTQKADRLACWLPVGTKQSRSGAGSLAPANPNKEDCTMKTLSIKSNGIPFNVVLHLNSENKQVVSFYDARYDFTEYGQFTGGSYYVEDIADHEGGLCLHGGVSDWNIDEKGMKRVVKWLAKA
jgi:hypothetical protein